MDQEEVVYKNICRIFRFSIVTNIIFVIGTSKWVNIFNAY